MRKFISVILIILLAIGVTATLLACVDNGTETDESLKIYGDTDVFEFYVGKINWSLIKLSVYDKDTATGSIISAKESMVAEEDLAKLATPGTYTISLIYQGSTVSVTLVIKEKKIVPEYTATFNAGEGTFNADGSQTDGSDVMVIVDSVISAIPTPLRAGYEFAGWYESADFSGNKIIAPYTLKRDITLYAKWTDERRYDITYSCYLDSNNKGIIQTVTGVEHGTEVSLLAPETKVGYDFAYYEIWDASELYNAETSYKIYPEDFEGTVAKYKITSDIKVKLQYTHKVLTLTFTAEGWGEGEVIGGVTIVNSTYIKEVAYGTALTEDELPVPTLPQKTGYTAKWVDDTTGKAPVFGTLTSSMVVRAEYTIMQFSMYFYTASDFSDESLIENATRTVDYNSYVTSIPDVPVRDGYNGEWMVYNKGYDPDVADNQPVAIQLKKLQMKEDIKVFAQYYPKTYDIGFVFRMEGMSNEVTIEKQFKYGEYIQASDVPDLTQDQVIDGVTYSGYSSKYYTIVWYTTNAHTTQVGFPVKVIGDSNYYYGVNQNSYKVEFRMQEGRDESINPDNYNISDSVKPGESYKPPQWILDAYTVVGWFCYVDAVEYDDSVAYENGSYVAYNGKYYRSSRYTPAGTLPTVKEFWDESAPVVQYNYKTNPEYRDGIPITDFHEYSEIETENRAFYPILEYKVYTVEFFNIDVETGATKYLESVSIQHGKTIGASLIEESALRKKVYDNTPSDTYVFDGWYTDADGLTLPIDSSFTVSESVALYARWTNTLVGTDGLNYVEYKGGYAISSFTPKNAEYSHISVRIPASHGGLPVVAILDNAFDAYDKVIFITELIIGANVCEIGENAFGTCGSVTKITLDDNTNFKVGTDGCLYSGDGKSLYLVLAKSVSGAFVVPATVTSIVGGAFANANEITKVSFASGSVIETIGDYAFDGCSKLSEITLPATLKSIGDYAFRGCDKLANINLTDNSALYKVGYGAFADCEEALNTDGDFLTIGNVLVKYLGNASTLTLNDSFVGIADGAFHRDELDPEITTYALTALYIGSTSKLKYIGAKAFDSCSLLTEIHLSTSEFVEADETAFDGITLSCKLYVPSGLYNRYENEVAYTQFVDSEGESLLIIE